MSQIEQSQKDDKIVDHYANMAGPPGEGVIATIFVVALFGFIAWGMGDVQTQPSSTSTSATQASQPPLVNPPLAVPPKT